MKLRGMEQFVTESLVNEWDCTIENLYLLGVADGRQCYRIESNRGSLFVKVQDAPAGVDSDILHGLKIQRFLFESGIRVSEILPGRSGLGYAQANGCCLTVEKWVEQEDLRLDPSTWKELGILCGQVHSLSIPPEILDLASRLDPLKTLNKVQACIAKHAGYAPNQFAVPVRAYLSEAEAFGGLEGLPRTIVHSDITWGNVVRTRRGLTMLDLEGAGIAPAVMDLVEVTTKLCTGPSGSGPLNREAAYSFYQGYRQQRLLSAEEIKSFGKAHLYHQLYYLANSLERGDFDFINRMGARLRDWQEGVFETLADAASR